MEQHLSTQKFTELELAPPLLKGLAELNFQFCTPIQALTLPLALTGRDVAGQAQTGTGKTAAFLLTIMNHLLRSTSPDTSNGNGEDNGYQQGQRADDIRCQPRAVVLAPTRELAIQIHQDALALGQYTDVRFGLVYGGTGYEKQRIELSAGVDVLIGTPGRLLDYYRQGLFTLAGVEIVVLDEADRMFDLGFIRDIRFFLRRMPPPQKRQSMLFSATLSLRVDELAYMHMNEPQRLVVDGERRLAEGIEEKILFPASEEKLPLLVHFLRNLEVERCLVFANTRVMVDSVSDSLNCNGFESGVLSSSIPQPKRERLLGDFKSGKLRVLVATDVAARGLHIEGVSHVVNFDLPQDCEDYVHRIGRTARAGASGVAISLACDKYAMHLPEIEGYIGHAIPREHAALQDLPQLQAPARRPPRERRGTENRGRGTQRDARGPSRDAQNQRRASNSDRAGNGNRQQTQGRASGEGVRQGHQGHQAAARRVPNKVASASRAPNHAPLGTNSAPLGRQLETPAVG